MTDNPWLLMDGMIVDSAPQYLPLTPGDRSRLDLPKISSDKAVQVEIIGPSEPSIFNWIEEAEQKLHTDGRTTQR
jgi:hypothetical protein